MYVFSLLIVTRLPLLTNAFNGLTGCRGKYFTCDDPEKCHDLSKLCDGVQDCLDNFDEANHKCNSKTFKYSLHHLVT